MTYIIPTFINIYISIKENHLRSIFEYCNNEDIG